MSAGPARAADVRLTTPRVLDVMFRSSAGADWSWQLGRGQRCRASVRARTKVSNRDSRLWLSMGYSSIDDGLLNDIGAMKAIHVGLGGVPRPGSAWRQPGRGRSRYTGSA